MSDNIFGGKQGDNIWDTAGVTNITLIAPNNDTIFYSQFELNSDSDCAFALVITDHWGNFDGNGFTGTRVTTITGFTPGTDTSVASGGEIGNQDTVDFNTNSWGFGIRQHTTMVLFPATSQRVHNQGDHYANVFLNTATNRTLNANNDLIAIAGTYTRTPREQRTHSQVPPSTLILLASGSLRVIQCRHACCL